MVVHCATAKTNLDSYKVEPTLSGERLGDHGFRAARWSVHQEALWLSDAHAGERVRVLQGPLDALLEFVLQVFLPSDIFPRHLQRRDHNLQLWNWMNLG